MACIHGLARLGIAFIWLWQGLVPKLIFASVDERAMIAAAGLPQSILPAIGAVELGFAAATLVLWRWRRFFLWNATIMAVALAAVALRSPAYLIAAFNPVTLNVGMALISVIGYLSAFELPSASKCLRRAPSKTV